MAKIEDLIKMVDDELELHDPSSDEWKALLEHREALLKQDGMLLEQSRKRKPSPDTVMQCITGFVQVVGVAIVGFVTRIDREALRFIKKP